MHLRLHTPLDPRQWTSSPMFFLHFVGQGTPKLRLPPSFPSCVDVLHEWWRIRDPSLDSDGFGVSWVLPVVLPGCWEIVTTRIFGHVWGAGIPKNKHLMCQYYCWMVQKSGREKPPFGCIKNLVNNIRYTYQPASPDFWTINSSGKSCPKPRYDQASQSWANHFC